MWQVHERSPWWLFHSRKQGGGSSEKPLEASSSGSRLVPELRECRDVLHFG